MAAGNDPARETIKGPDVPPERWAEINRLLEGAIDLHCHSGPAAMPRILDHHEAMMECSEAGFRALVYKDHFYLGTPHALLLEKLFPDTGVRLFSGIALNNASGGINPHAVNHAINIGAKIVWMPTLSAANHLKQVEGTNFPKTARRMLPAEPLSALDAEGRVSDACKEVCDLIAEGDIILASGHLPANELHLLFEEAKKRGVTKMMVNHPTFMIGCTDEDIRQMAGNGVYMEHECGMFTRSDEPPFGPGDLRRLIDVAGVERTIICSDLGLRGSPRPVAGFRLMVDILLDLQFSEADIRRLTSRNAARMLNLDHGAA
jgi:hypothetical protein